MRRLTKSKDKLFLGVLGGVAEYFGWDTSVVRMVYAALTVFGMGSPILLYLIMAFIIPEE